MFNKKEIKQYIQINIIPFFAYLFIRFIYLTNKKQFHYPKDGVPKDNFIIAFWHGNLLMQPSNYYHFKPKGDMRAIISEHRDGRAIANTVRHLKVGSFDGSSSKNGAKALIGAIKALKNGVDIAITPDGPQGPIYSVADGIVALSQKSKAKILPFSVIPTKYWQLGSWDKFIIPKPFGTIDFYIDEPFDVEDMNMEDAKKLIQTKMMIHSMEGVDVAK